MILSGIPGFMCQEDNGGSLCAGFYIMIAGRVLSGVGEASTAVVVLPFLDDVLPAARKGLYLAIYFSAIPVGTACGFLWAGILTHMTNGKWQYAFLLEAPIMVPFAVLASQVRYVLHENPAIGGTGSVGNPRENENEEEHGNGSLMDGGKMPLLYSRNRGSSSGFRSTFCYERSFGVSCKPNICSYMPGLFCLHGSNSRFRLLRANFYSDV